MKTALILPDIHGRSFWRDACETIEKYDKVIFLGDYLDPYDFENISVRSAIDNFRLIIDFKKKNKEKVILLLGNHDMPYYSSTYFNFSPWHCRHSVSYHNEISQIFEENKDLFQIAYDYNGILFTHAGVDYYWLTDVLESDSCNLPELTQRLNGLTESEEGLRKLYMVSWSRGGWDIYASCIWCDVEDMMAVADKMDIRQVFGHTLQAYDNLDGEIEYGEPIEFDNNKMLDCAQGFVLDCDNFVLLKK